MKSEFLRAPHLRGDDSLNQKGFLYWLYLLAMTSALLASQASAVELNILTTIRPLYGIVKSVAGNQNTVNILIDQNQSPHDYHLKPSDMVKINAANAIFMIDDDFEFGLATALKKKHLVTKIIKFSSNIHLHLLKNREELDIDERDDERAHHHHHHDGAFDLHFWLDPNNAIVMASEVADVLGQLDPQNKKLYQSNAKEFAIKIEILDQKLNAKLAETNSSFITFHDGYQYFSRHYHLRNVGAVMMNHNITPGVRSLIRLRNIIHDQHVKCLFSEPQYSTTAIDKIAAETGARVGIIDGEYGTGLELDGEIYFNLINSIGDEMLRCFKK